MAGIPPPPPGFELDAAPAALPPPPPGFTVDSSNAAIEGPQDTGIAPAVKQAAAGFNEGIAPVLNAPNILANAGVNLVRRAIGGEPQPDPVTQNYERAFVAPAGQPQTRVQKAMRAGGEMAGANVPFLATGLGAAANGVRSGVTMGEQAAGGVLPKVRGAIDQVMEWMAAHPTTAATTDTLGAFESGAGGQVGRQVGIDRGASPDEQRAYELAGQLGTPAAFAAWSRWGLTPLAARAAKFGVGKAAQMVPESVLPEGFQSGMTPAQRTADRLAYSNREGKYADPNVPAPPEPNALVRNMDAGANKRAADAADTVRTEMAQIQARPEAAANQSIADRLKKQIPGFAPGVAKETGDPALLNLQARLESNATGPELRTAQDRYDASAGALRDKFQSLAPPAGENPQDLAVNAATGKVSRDQALTGLQKDVVQNQLKTGAEALPEPNKAASGAKLRELQDYAETASDMNTTALRNKIAAPETPVTFTDAAGNEVSMPVKDVLDRRAAINQQLRQYRSATARTVDDVKQMQTLQDERNNLDQVIENVNLPGMKEYRDYYKNQHVPQFEEGASRDIARYDRFGYDKNKVPDEKVLDQFGGPNNISAAKQFTRVHGDNPEAVQLMADHQLGRLKAEALDPKTGAISQQKFNKFLNNNKELLDALPPGVRTAVAAKNPDALYAKLADIEQRQRAAADTRVTELLGMTPEKAMNAALSDWQLMRDLKAKVSGSPQNEAALTRAVMNDAPDVMDAKAFGEWLDGHDRVLRQVITPQHLAALKDIVKAAKIQTQLPRPSGTAELPTNRIGRVGKLIGLPIKSVLQRSLAWQQGRVGGKYTVMDIATRMYDAFTSRETDAIWKEALFNPKVAETLQQVVRNKGATKLQLSRLHNYLLTVGSVDSGQDYPYQK